MKRLLTLFALLAVFMGVKAAQTTVYDMNYSWYSGFPFYVMGYVPEWNDGIMTDYGANYKYAEVKEDAEETSDVIVTTHSGGKYYRWTEGGGWHQYFLADGIPTEIGGSYKVTAMVRASEPVTIRVNMGWSWTEDPQGVSVSIPQSNEFVEVEWEYTGIGGTSCNLVAQPGNCAATIEWQSVIVSQSLESGQPVDPAGELVEDYSIDYSGYRAFPFYVMDYLPEWNNGIMTDYGAMYLYKKTADVTEDDNVVGEVYANNGTVYNKILLNEPVWHQYFLADGISTAVGENYIVRAQVRASEDCNILLVMGDWSTAISSTATIPGSSEFQTVEWEFKSVPAATSFILSHAGTCTATIEWQSLTVYHYKDGGEIQPKETIDIYPNPTEVVVYGKERNYTQSEAENLGISIDEYEAGYAWDNQFFIVANRTLGVGEKTIISFDYMATEYARTTTQCHAEPGGYLHWSAIGDVEFSPEWQHFEKEFIVPENAKGMQTLAFNMAEIKEACDYHISNIVWKLADDTETLINMEGVDNFWVKEGAGTAPYIYINNVPEPQNPEQGNLEMVYNIDYSIYGGFPFYVMGYVPEWNNGLMTDYGANYNYVTLDNEEGLTSDHIVTTNSGTQYYRIESESPAWHQYFLADGIRTEIDEKYVVKAKVKASEPTTINVNMRWSWAEDPANVSVYVPDEWAEVEWEYSGIGGTQCWLVAQPGISTATIEWASLAVYKYQNGQLQPVEWIELLTNGDAETSWKEMGLADVNFNDAENNYKVSAWGRVKGVNIGYDAQRDMENWCPFPADIETDPDSVSNHIFVVHASYADSMEDDGNASAWDNQFWIQSPQGWKAGDQVKIHFRYKASQNARTSTQVHKQAPMEYLIWHAIGDVYFTTEWQEFDGIMTIGEDMSGTWSIAFNLNDEVKDPTDFYFDDLSWKAMKLEEGWFVAGANLNSGLEYDCSNATEFVYDDMYQCYTATIGSFGKPETWVNQLIISTVRGDNQAFKGHAIKINGTVTDNADDWFDYTESSNAKINLPGEGVWQIYIDTVDKLINFAMLEGKITDPVEIVTNPTEVTVYAQERDYTNGEREALGLEPVDYSGNIWDNQFFIVANRPLRAGEVTHIEFDYKANKEAYASTQTHATPGAYIHWSAIGNVDFNTEWQHFSMDFTVPAEAEGKDAQTIAFNMAEIKEACNYSIRNISWYLQNENLDGMTAENLIDGEGTRNFYVKEGAGTNPREFDPYYVPQETLMGDVDGSGQVNVTDVVMIIDNILGKSQWNFNAEVADVNYDNYINVTDVVMVIDHILGKLNLNRAAAADAEMGAISLSSDMTTVSLTNPSAYTAFQMDVTLPMGVSLEDVLLTERAAGSHSVVISKMEDGSYRIIGVSMQNKAFEGNAGDLLKLQLAGNAQGAVAINNVLFVTPQGVQHELAGVNAFGDVTGIANVNGNKEVTGNVFDLQGRQMNNAQLKKGLYILNGKKQIVK